MSMDLIMSDRGDVLIASNEPFSGPIARVDFHVGRKLLMLSFEDIDKENELLNLEVHDRMMSALLKAPSVLLVHMSGNKAVSGFEVPLVQAEFGAV